MRLHENTDFTTLTWVKPELDETLQQARNALLTYVEEGEDPGQLRTCANCLHQVQGTLRMVELYGAAMVAEEMEQLTRALVEAKIEDRDAAYSVLMQGIVQLPDYLERLQSGYRDIPIVLLPLLNGLRAARGEKDLSEAVLFSPDLTLPLPASAQGPAKPLPQDELRAKAEVLSGQFQTALLRWLKDDHSPDALASLTRVCEQLVPITDAESARRLFWVAAGTLDALSRGTFEAAKPLKQSLAKVEREIKRLAAQGDAAFRSDPPIELTKQLLYFVAHAPTSEGRISEIREAFGLDTVGPNEAELAHAQGSLTGHNRALLSTVAGAIKEDLLRVKDALDLHMRTPGATTTELGAQVEALDRVADTLGMLGLNVPRRVVEEQRSSIQDVVNGNRQANESTLLDIAGALLYVEASLDDQVERLGQSGDESPQPQGAMPASETRKLLEVLIKEAIGNFAQARQCYVAFVETHWDHAQLADVPRLLEEVSGALRILDINRPPQYITAIRRFTERELLRRQRVPNAQQMDRLADSLASLEYYLEAFRDRRPNREHILDVAEESLKALGYWPLEEEEAEVEVVEVVAAPAPEAVVATLPPVEIALAPAMAFETPVEAEPVVEAAPVVETMPEVAPVVTAEPMLEMAAVEPALAMPAVEPEPSIPDMVPPVAPELPIVAAVAAVAAPAPEPVVMAVATVAALPIPGYDSSNEEIDDEIREVFLEEFEEEIGNLEQQLPAWRAAPDKADLMRPIRRVFHTLKGSGRLVGAKALGEFSWKVESLLNRVLDGSRPATPAVVAVVEKAFETLPVLRAALQGETVYADLAGIEAIADRVAAGEEVHYQVAAPVAALAEMPAEETMVEPTVEAAEPVVESEVVEVPAVEESVPEGLEFSIDPVLFEILKPEVHGHLEVVDAWLAQCSIRGPQPVNDPLLRSIHTMNGAFAMTEVSTITEVTAPLETYIKRSLAHQVVPNHHGIEAVSDAARAIRQTIAALDKPRPVLPAFAALAARIVALRDYLPESMMPSVPLHLEQEEAPVSVMPQVAVMEMPDASAIPDFAVENAADVLPEPVAEASAEAEAAVEMATTIDMADQGASVDASFEDVPAAEAEAEATVDVHPEVIAEAEAVETAAVDVADLTAPEEVVEAEAPLAEVPEVEAVELESAQIVTEEPALAETVVEEWATWEPASEPAAAEDETALEAIELPVFEQPVESSQAEVEQAAVEDVAIEDFAMELSEEPVEEPAPAEVLEAPAVDEIEALAGSVEGADGFAAEFAAEAEEEAASEQPTAIPVQEEVDTFAEVENTEAEAAQPADDANVDAEPLAAETNAAEDSDAALAAMIAAYATEVPAVPEAPQEAAETSEPMLDAVDETMAGQAVDKEVAAEEIAADEAAVEETEVAIDATAADEVPEVEMADEETFASEDMSVFALEEAVAADMPAEIPLEAPAEPAAAADDFYGMSEEELEKLTSPEPASAELPVSEPTAEIDVAEPQAAIEAMVAEVVADHEVATTAVAEEMPAEDHVEVETPTMAEAVEAPEALADAAMVESAAVEALAEPEAEEIVFADDSGQDVPEVEAPVAIEAEEPERASIESLVVPQAMDPDDPEAGLDMSDLDPELLDIFLEESSDILDHSDGLLAKLRNDPSNQELVVGLQRDLHTLKGGARMSGIYAVGELGHAMESLLESAAEGRHPLTAVGVTVLERAFDRLHGMVGRVGERKALALPANLIVQIDTLSRGEPLLAEPAGEMEAGAGVEPVVSAAMVPADAEQADLATTGMAASSEPAAVEGEPAVAPVAASAPAAPSTTLKPLSAPVDGLGEEDELTSVRAPQEQVRIRADLLDQLVTYAGEVAIYRARLEQQLGAFRANLGELDQTTTRLREQLRRLDIETEAQISARYLREGEDKETGFDPLELDRFTNQQQLSRALAESANDLVNLQTSLDDLTRQYETLLLQQSRVSSDLQEGLMRTRMVPFDALVPRLRRVLRQASMDSGKQVQLKVDGASGEMDRNVLDRMTAPLEHMLRNSVAHGLELPADRRKAKKPDEGTVRIVVLREGSEVVLKVIDDGKGLNKEAIRRKAIERGLRKPEDVMSDEELYGMILETGFSTAETVSRLSGRGVGMDVVYSEIRQLGGSLQIRSTEGLGSEFIIRLPFTLAVTKAVFVKIGDTNFAVPIASVQGVGRIARSELEKQLASDSPKFMYAGEDYAIHDLGHLIGHAPAKAAESLQMPLLLARSGDLRAAISIDQVLGSREIVVKPVGPQVNSVPGIFGATIMGDGRVVVILDVAPLVRRQAAISREAQMAPPAPAPVARRVPAVMVVDDSITMRKVTGRVLERHNFEVLTAKDGVDAVEKMAERVPDLVLLDIEMPRMDGYEVAQNMRNDPRLREVPIIMITSRTGDKHRQRAMEIGVNRYLGKPYQEPELMRNVFEMLGMEPVNG